MILVYCMLSFSQAAFLCDVWFL